MVSDEALSVPGLISGPKPNCACERLSVSPIENNTKAIARERIAGFPIMSLDVIATGNVTSGMMSRRLRDGCSCDDWHFCTDWMRTASAICDEMAGGFVGAVHPGEASFVES